MVKLEGGDVAKSYACNGLGEVPRTALDLDWIFILRIGWFRRLRGGYRRESKDIRSSPPLTEGHRGYAATAPLRWDP